LVFLCGVVLRPIFLPIWTAIPRNSMGRCLAKRLIASAVRKLNRQSGAGNLFAFAGVTLADVGQGKVDVVVTFMAPVPTFDSRGTDLAALLLDGVAGYLPRMAQSAPKFVAASKPARGEGVNGSRGLVGGT